MLSNQIPSLDFDLGETADLLRDTVMSFAADQIAPRAEEIDRTNEFPRDLWPRLGALGLHGITVEEELGGAGMGYLEHCVAMEGPRPPSACPTAPIPTSASIRSGATAARIRSAATCPS
jgi:hypothetical protein